VNVPGITVNISRSQLLTAATTGGRTLRLVGPRIDYGEEIRQAVKPVCHLAYRIVPETA